MRWSALLFGLSTALASQPVSAADDVSVERGAYVAITHGCHDCHTEGYDVSGGKINPDAALKGTAIGWRGPWGTTYALNLRLTIVEKAKTEGEFVNFAKSFKTRPPMPWFNVNAMQESDLRSLYRYIKSLGEPGEQVPEDIGPDEEPKTPYYLLAPTPPKNQ
jgi:mono/diheme cytochrome c family protein